MSMYSIVLSNGFFLVSSDGCFELNVGLSASINENMVATRFVINFVITSFVAKYILLLPTYDNILFFCNESITAM